MRLLSIVVLCSLFALTSCKEGGDNKQTAETEKEEKLPPQSKLNAEGTTGLVNVLLKYYDLKNALVKTDGTEAAAAAEQLAMVTTNLQATTVGDSTASTVLNANLDTIKTMSMAIAATHPGEVETMRASFEKVSDNMFALLKNADLQHAGVYRQYCPMAFNDKGAYWLSEEEEIKNPYFGKKMLSCGEVTDSLK